MVSLIYSACCLISNLNLKFCVFVGPLLDRNLVVWSLQRESERRKETNIPWVTQLAFALQGISQKERERKKERHGDPSSDGAKVFY